MILILVKFILDCYLAHCGEYNEGGVGKVMIFIEVTMMIRFVLIFQYFHSCLLMNTGTT